MKRLCSPIIVIAFALIFVSCRKEYTGSGLSGTWVKGSNAGDTLQFLRKNNKNILRHNISFNAAMPAFKEVEYKYEGEKLSVNSTLPQQRIIYPSNSFTWKHAGSEFEILGIELLSIGSKSWFCLQSLHPFGDLIMATIITPLWG